MSTAGVRLVHKLLHQGIILFRLIVWYIRLAETSSASRGRVEIYHPAYGWETMFDDGFGQPDGNVICRQLGYNGASSYYHNAHYGEGTGTILLDDLGCSGSESYIWDCPNSGWANHNCGHHEDLSVDFY